MHFNNIIFLEISVIIFSRAKLLEFHDYTPRIYIIEKKNEKERKKQ